MNNGRLARVQVEECTAHAQTNQVPAASVRKVLPVRTKTHEVRHRLSLHQLKHQTHTLLCNIHQSPIDEHDVWMPDLPEDPDFIGKRIHPPQYCLASTATECF